jgi:hypothetical protein
LNAIAFEVQVQNSGRWITDCICRREEEARDLCAKLITSKDGVRIVRAFSPPGSEYPVETVIHTETREARKKTIQVTPIEETAFCKTSGDFLGRDSRMTISRLLRQYLEDKALTASELLHNPGEMKRLNNFEALLPNAVSRIAALQGKQTGEDSRVRRDAIFGCLDELRVKAEKASSRKDLPYPRETGWGAAMTHLETVAGGDAGEAEYLGKVVLCRDLVNIRNLLGKVEWMLEMCDPGGTAPRHVSMLDSVVADVVGSAEVVRDLLGRQPDLATALHRLLDLMDGTFEAQPREQAPEVTGLLSQFVASGQGPDTCAVLLDFFQRQVRSTARLAGHEREDNLAAYKKLLERVMRPGGMMGGARTAEAFTLGYFRFLEQGGGEGRRLSIEAVLGCLPWGADRLGYLALLSGSDVGRAEMETVCERVRAQVGGHGGINAMVAQAVPLKPKMQTMAALYNAITNSGLPEDVRVLAADRVDTMVADYIVNNRIIQKLDDPTATLRVRAVRLITFASTEVLSSPKARKMVRDQIIGHLRQPNFDAKFIEGLTPEEQVVALRNFYDLLNKAQFA